MRAFVGALVTIVALLAFWCCLFLMSDSGGFGGTKYSTAWAMGVTAKDCSVRAAISEYALKHKGNLPGSIEDMAEEAAPRLPWESWSAYMAKRRARGFLMAVAVVLFWCSVFGWTRRWSSRVIVTSLCLAVILVGAAVVVIWPSAPTHAYLHNYTILPHKGRETPVGTIIAFRYLIPGRGNFGPASQACVFVVVTDLHEDAGSGCVGMEHLKSEEIDRLFARKKGPVTMPPEPPGDFPWR